MNVKNNFLIVFFFLFVNHLLAQNENDYFYKITKEISPVIADKNKVRDIISREMKRYDETREFKYLISYKYAELSLQEDPVIRIPKIFHLLKINESKYPFIDMECNFDLALQFENSSPKLAMTYLNEAIKKDKISKGYFAGHLYHAKGRFFYSDNDLVNAKKYFLLALSHFNNGDLLYVSSMYNNLGLVDLQQRKYKESELKIRRGISILNRKSFFTRGDQDFLYIMYGNLATTLIKQQKFYEAKMIIEQNINYLEGSGIYDTEFLKSKRKLLSVLRNLHLIDEQVRLITDLKKNERKFKDLNEQILFYKILQEHYTDFDLNQLKNTVVKLQILNDLYDKENRNNVKNINDLLNNQIIKNIQEKYNSQLKIEKQKKLVIALAIVLLLGLLIIMIIVRHNKKLRVINCKKNILESEILVHREKTKYMQKSMHLKIETEKAFLENIKLLKKKNTNPENLLKDLMFKVNSLIQIDNKNEEFISQVHSENFSFMVKLSEKFPDLTDKEKHLCRYFRLGLSAKEISTLESTTDGTVRVYKTKIKSKLGLDRNKSLEEFLNSL